MNNQKESSLIETSDKTTIALSFAFMVFNYFWGVTKVIIGFTSKTYFYSASGFCEILLGVCKTLFLIGNNRTDKNQQIRIYKSISLIIVFANLLYLTYMVSLFFVKEEKTIFPLWACILICVIAFADLVLSVIGIIKNIKRKSLMFVARKCLSLVWSFQAMAFTVSSLLVAINEEISIKNLSNANAILGLVFGSLSLLVGVLMVIKLKQHRKNNTKIK